MPAFRLFAIWALIFGGPGFSLLAAGATHVPLASLRQTFLGRASVEPVVFHGTITFLDPARDLMVLQDGEDVVALHSDLVLTGLEPGMRVALEGMLGPLIAAAPHYPYQPDGLAVQPRFEAPTNWSECFLSRLRGIVHPPASGSYTFWIASDDSSELWLSDSEDPAGAKRIAQVGTGRWAEPHQWYRHLSQQSVSIPLEAGRGYYLEALGQDTSGADNLSVAWKGPGLDQAVIEAKYVSLLPGWVVDDSGASGTGVVWDYWTNFYAAELSVLRVADTNVLACRQTRLLESEPGMLPLPRRIEDGQLLDEASNHRLVELEGRVDFVSETQDGWILVLRRGSARITVRLGVLGDLASVLPNDSLVRVSGFFESGHPLDRDTSTGTIWPVTTNGLTWLSNNENWALVKPVAQRALTAANPELCAGQIIRTQGRVVGPETDHLWLVQGKDTIRGYYSSNGLDWVSAGPDLEVGLSNAVLVGFALSSHQTGQLATVELDRLHGFSKRWSGTDIGIPSVPGGLHVGDDQLFLQGSGDDIWHVADQCYFAYQTLRGDFDIHLRLSELRGTDYGAKAVLMVRESLAAASPWAGVVTMPGNRVGIQGRVVSGDSAAGALNVLDPSATWVRLERLRNHFLIRPDSAALQPGQMLDVLGEVAWQGQSVVLERVRTREVPAAPDTVNAVTTREQLSGDPRDVPVSELEAEAKRALRMTRQVILRLQGVLTFNAAVGGEWITFIQDQSGVARIQWRARQLRTAVSVGDWVEVIGTPGLGESGRVFVAHGVRPMGSGEMPDPSYFQNASPRDSTSDGQWTEVEGVGRASPSDATLLLTTRKGDVEVHLEGLSAPSQGRWVNASIRVRGALRKSPAPLLLVPSERYVEYIEAPPTDPFGIRILPVTRLQSLETDPGAARMYKIRGTVTCRRGDTLFVQDQSGGIAVESRSVSDVSVGDEVEVVGFPGVRGNGVLLTEALLRPVGRGPLPAPTKLSPESVLQGQNNGRLVSAEAVLLAQHPGSELQTLDLQLGQRAFQASLPAGQGALPRMIAGSRLRVTGVARAEGVEAALPGGANGVTPLVGTLELWLRSPQDVLVIERPPWWNWKYTAATCAVIVAVFIGAILWIRTLRRRVEERTLELRKTMNQLQKETRISATLAERDRLAAEIHDSVEQGLSAIMMQMDAAAKLVGQPGEIKRYLLMAKNMASFSRTEVQHAVWDLQSPLLENSDLPTALRRVARDISAGDMPRVILEISGSVFPLPSAIEHHLIRIAQEAMTNSVKHGEPRTIEVSLQYSPEAVVLRLRDDGTGFVPEAISTEGGHFGLQGMRIRAAKLGAEFTLESRPGAGTFIQLIVHPEMAEAPGPSSQAVKD